MRYKLGDICQIINGRAYKQPELLDAGKYLVLRVGNFFSSDRWYYSDLELPDKNYCNKGDLLYAWACSFGPRIWEGEDRTIFHYHIWKLIPDEKIVDKTYLYYLLKLSTRRLLAGTHGSVMIHITKFDMERSEFELPSLLKQKQIAKVLQGVDRKIAINNRINGCLFEQAQSLFKEWFMDFRPFSDNGEKPLDWNDCKVGDIVDIHDSKRIPLSSDQRAKMEKKYPYYGAASLMDYVDNYLFDGIYLLLGEDGTVITDDGFPILQYVEGQFWVNNHAHILTGKNGFSVEDIYLFFSITNIKSIVTGAVQPKVSQANLKNLPAIMPPRSVLVRFHSIVNPLFDEFRKNRKEISRLESIRDFLLPKLMSGEIDVDSIEVN